MNPAGTFPALLEAFFVDGMTIDDARDYLREHWPSIRSRLLAGTYQPQPVKPSPTCAARP